MPRAQSLHSFGNTADWIKRFTSLVADTRTHVYFGFSAAINAQENQLEKLRSNIEAVSLAGVCRSYLSFSPALLASPRQPLIKQQLSLESVRLVAVKTRNDCQCCHTSTNVRK